MGIAAAGVGIYTVFPGLRRSDCQPNSSIESIPDTDNLGEQPRSEHVLEPEDYRPGRVEARYYSRNEDGTVTCDLCFRRCRVAHGREGFCRNRANSRGVMYNAVYGLPSAIAVEPTEKEPMHHFLPGSNILCIGTASCNYRCRFCHNWHLSQSNVKQVSRRHTITPAEMVARAKRHRVPGLSFTYNEPTVFFEYGYDIAVRARDTGLRVIMHTNGGLTLKPLRDMLRFIDGVTVDLKAFSRQFYQDFCEAELAPVLRSLAAIKADGTWLEVVNLVLPGHNDSPEEIRAMCGWMRAELGPDTPLHFSRFFPAFRMTNLSPTPVPTLERCREIATAEGLHFVSIGNVPGHEANSSFCPGCGSRIIRRHHFSVSEIRIKDGRCEDCGRTIPGVWT